MPPKKSGETSKELATTGSTDLANINTDQMAFLAERAGQGAERVSMADIIMPRISVLQDLSPQVKRNKPEFIEGAQPGLICNAATRQIMETIRVLPCLYIRHHIEWKPNRGGFVADHGEAGEALMAQTRRNADNYDVLPNGNLLVPTPTWYCLDLDHGGQQIVIPMPRTQSKASRQWMSMATSERLRRVADDPTTEFQPPLFFRSYTLGSFLRQEEQNDWFVFTVERGQDIFALDRPELMSAAAKFRDMLMSGEIKADASSFADDQSAGGGRSREEDDDRPM